MTCGSVAIATTSFSNSGFLGLEIEEGTQGAVTRRFRPEFPRSENPSPERSLAYRCGFRPLVARTLAHDNVPKRARASGWCWFGARACWAGRQRTARARRNPDGLLMRRQMSCFARSRQFGSAPVAAARQFRLRIPRVHAKAQPGQSIAQRLDQRQQGVGLLHRFAARKRDSFERALLMRRYDQIRYFSHAPFFAYKEWVSGFQQLRQPSVQPWK